MNVAKESKLRRTKKLRESRVATSVAQSYRVDFETSVHLSPQEDDGITTVVGKIIHEQNATVAGKLHGYCVRSECVAEIHRSLDDSNPDLYDVASLVWDPDEQTYRDELGGAGDLIVPWTITLLPEHRGKGVGLLALWRFIDYFGSGAAIAVLKPFPLNHQESKSNDADYEKMQYGQFAQVSKKDGQARLATHWGKLGFKQLPGSDFFYLDMRCVHPSLEDLIKKERR